MANDKIKKVRIGKRLFVMRRLPVADSLGLNLRLAKVLGAVLPRDAGNVDVTSLSNGSDVMGVLSLLGSGMSGIDADATAALVKDLCGKCQIQEGNEVADVDFDLTFEDDLLGAYELAVEFAKFEYGAFIQGLMQKFGMQKTVNPVAPTGAE